MKKSLIAVFAMAACCFAANPYTGLMKNLNIATFGIEDYSKKYGNHDDDLTKNVDFAKGFRTSLQNHVSKKYPTTTFSGSYSNAESSDATVSNFQKEIKKDHNIVMLSSHGLSINTRYPDGSVVRSHNVAVMYDGNLPVENMSFSEKTYFAFIHACNFLSFYTDKKSRKESGFYYKYRNDTEPVKIPVTNYSEGDDDGWEDSKEAKPQNLAYSKFVNAFTNGLHGMFGFSSVTITMATKKNGVEYADPALYETFAQKWVDDGLRIWQAYKYAVWKIIYQKHCGPGEKIEGVEPAVIYKSGTAIGNDGKNHSFKGYCEFYKTIYQYPMKKGSLGRKKAVYGYPEY